MLISFVTKFVYNPSWNQLTAFRKQKLETNLVNLELREYDGTGYNMEHGNIFIMVDIPIRNTKTQF